MNIINTKIFPQHASRANTIMPCPGIACHTTQLFHLQNHKLCMINPIVKRQYLIFFFLYLHVHVLNIGMDVHQ